MRRRAEPYSGTNTVPKAATNLKSLLHPEQVKPQDQDGKAEQKETQKRAGKMSKGKIMKVRDPTTGDEVEIRNAGEGSEGASAENVLNTDFPPPDWAQHRRYMLSITTSSMLATATAYTTSTLVLHFLPLPFLPQYSFVRVLVTLLFPSLAAYILLYRLRHAAQGDFEDRVWHSERVRGLKAGSDLNSDGKVETEERTKESAEWANTLLRGIWPIVNPKLFQSSVDLLEDIMQSSVPSFIHSVRVADLGQGRNPLRITAVRSLRDVDTDESMQRLDDKEKEQFDGEHVNLEVSFAYRAVPSGKSTSSKAKNAHLLIEFFTGIKGVYSFSVPVWVELKGVVGTARARLQLISDPPFVKTTLITMMGLPRIDIKVTPTKLFPNVMSLPVVSEFISSSIDTAAAQYVAPRSLTLDLQQLISGDDIIKDTKAIGVLVVHIHRATGIKKMDSKGSSGLISPQHSIFAAVCLPHLELADPYITLTFSRLGKPMFSTRIIKDDLNPVFEETALLLVNIDNVKLREQLSIQLWDSDRMSADDMMGFVEVDIAERLRNKNQVTRRIAPLKSPDRKSRPGSVEFTVGYYAKMWPNSTLKTDGSDPGIPEDLRHEPEFKEARGTVLNDLEAAVLVTPPDENYPTGILSIEVHEATDLSVRTEGKETRGKREGDKGQDEAGEDQEEGEGLPSSYCTISINDELIYETRVKPLSSSPMFNAGTERLLRDWRNSHVTVNVKDSRVRENDAVLGLVVLKLSDLFVNASQVTRSYPLEKGGRIRVSVLFRPVELKLPRTLLGFNTGTLELREVTVKMVRRPFSLVNCELRLRTSTSSEGEHVSRKQAEQSHAGDIGWLVSEKIHLPVRQRHHSALFVTFKSLGLKNPGTSAYGGLWLRDLVDNEATKLEIALWKSKNGDYSRLKQNYVPPDGNLKGWDSDGGAISRIGSVWLDVTLIPGISEAHRKTMAHADAKKRGMWDEFVREKAGGLRDNIGGTEHVGQQKPEGSHITDIQESDRGNDSAVSGSGSTIPHEEAIVEDSRGDEVESSGGEEGMWKERWHRWREEEEALHRDHRGIMQKKPARTAKWIKDNVERAGTKIKDRFSQQDREPDVETEV